MQVLTNGFSSRTFGFMSQRNTPPEGTTTNRPATVEDALRLSGTFLLTLVIILLITNGGAG